MGFATIVALMMSGCEKKEVEKVEAPAVKVEVLTLRNAPLPIWAEQVGKTQANKSVDVVARVQGRLEKIHFTPGQYVHKGDLLFTIEPTDYSAQVDRDKAQLQQDRASLELAKNDVARYRPLVEKDLSPREKLDQLIAKQREIEAMIEADKAVIRQASLSLSYTEVRAEISGKIGRNLIDIGNLVGSTPNDSLLTTIVNDDPMFVYFSPTNVQMQRMAKYQTTSAMRVKASQPDAVIEGKTTVYEGVVDFVNNVTDETTGTVSMRAALKNPKGTLSSGAFVDVKVFITDQLPVLAIPPLAVGENQLGSFVYVVDTNNTLKVVQVESEFSNKSMLIINNGLKAGDKIVVSSMLKLSEGMKVAPTETKAQLLPVTFE